MKNFENEYTEMMQEEMPDLWGRIEAGLTEKQPQTVTDITKEKMPAKKSVSRRFLKYSGLAAACLCMAIILPMLVYTHAAKSASEEVNSAAEYTEGKTKEVGVLAGKEEKVADNLPKEAAPLTAEAETAIPDGTVFKAVTVRILKVESMNYQTRYTAEVAADEEGILQEQETLQFLSIDSTAAVLETGKIYTIGLQYDAGADVFLYLDH